MGATVKTVPGWTMRSMRRRLGLSQAKVAKKIGVRSLTVSRWERGAVAAPHMALLAMRYLHLMGGGE